MTTVITAAVLSLTPAVAVAAPADEPAPPTDAQLAFLTPEQYEARWGASAAGEVSASMPSDAADAAVPAGVVDSTAVTSEDRASAPALDPGGGQDAKWWTIIWDYKDLRGTTTPIRLGDSKLGYSHYAQRHNLTSSKPIKAAFQTHKPDKASGARLEYISWATDMSNGSVRLQVRVIVQAATRTDDGKYRTPDGKNVGVITAYCQGYNKCPAWVNKI
ncbi:hypothetical protein M2302_002460 [Micromonospora sp. A200]|uniref:hypothetical protein n=1 Tax=Micromonospora sp. A200 TaxID=2940568 RepID=UPI0024749C0A|nr:hypothetical protein [Micromonospora sp. A200]MDH6462282.1 hypothetical protein [Micromonospora sp. A200]